MLVNLQYRSTETELMDDPDLNKKDLSMALSDINRVNTLLGGNAITIRSALKMISDKKIKENVTIADLGCGDGTMLRTLAVVCRQQKINADFVGIDLNVKTIAYAKEMSVAYPEISFITKDLLTLDPKEFSCDIIISTLTLHHISDHDIPKIIKKSLQLAKIGVIINDLHRNLIAYYLFKLFSLFFIKGFVAKNDGLVSIKRGFKKHELIRYANQIGISNYTIDWKWAFRYRWLIYS